VKATKRLDDAKAAEKKAKEHAESMLAAKNKRASELKSAKETAAKVAATHAGHVKKATEAAARDAETWKGRVDVATKAYNVQDGKLTLAQ
jgi:uncharacterized membrane-anchored protein